MTAERDRVQWWSCDNSALRIEQAQASQWTGLLEMLASRWAPCIPTRACSSTQWPQRGDTVTTSQTDMWPLTQGTGITTSFTRNTVSSCTGSRFLKAVSVWVSYIWAAGCLVAVDLQWQCFSLSCLYNLHTALTESLLVWPTVHLLVYLKHSNALEKKKKGLSSSRIVSRVHKDNILQLNISLVHWKLINCFSSHCMVYFRWWSEALVAVTVSSV